MDESTQILKDQIQKLPPELKKYLDDGRWVSKLQSILSNFSLEEYQKISVENEVLLVLVGLEPYTDLAENISKEAEIDFNMAKWISEDIIKNILEPASELAEMEIIAEENQPQSGVGNDFEQIILNQAKAMQPAVPPENLPTGENKPRQVHDYSKGNDPYREPAE